MGDPGDMGEEPDDGACPGAGCPDASPPPAAPTAVRVDRLELLDPHLTAGFLCFDVTSQVNTELADKLGTDGNGDGALDLSVLAVFRPLDQAAAATPVEISSGACTAAAEMSCRPDPATRVPTMAAGQDQGTCLEALPGTTGGGIDIPATPAPCFRTDPETISLELTGIRVALEDARLAATYVGDPATRLQGGLARGFLPEAVADGILVPENVAFVGGQPLSALLPGGTGNCAADERDLGPDGATTGWYLYFDFDASQAALVE